MIITKHTHTYTHTLARTHTLTHSLTHSLSVCLSVDKAEQECLRAATLSSGQHAQARELASATACLEEVCVCVCECGGVCVCVCVS